MLASQAEANSILPISVAPLEDTPEWKTWITDRAGMIAKDINAETQKQILASLGEGLDLGEGANELRVRVEGVMNQTSSVRAERIARTESKKASSTADIMVWNQSAVVTGKEWFTRSIHPCPYCESMEGRIVDLNENFFDLGASHEVTVTNKDGVERQVSTNYNYEAIQAPPLHVDCVCILLPVIVNL